MLAETNAENNVVRFTLADPELVGASLRAADESRGERVQRAYVDVVVRNHAPRVPGVGEEGRRPVGVTDFPTALR